MNENNLTRVRNSREMYGLRSGARIGMYISNSDLERYSEAIVDNIGYASCEFLEPGKKDERIMEGTIVKIMELKFTNEGEVIVDLDNSIRIRYSEESNPLVYEEKKALWDRSLPQVKDKEKDKVIPRLDELVYS
ncbi:MAG: hypothetical protein Q7S74_01215 [Nanoarchaeota archaeon]|nr:hypothetical protein [Nanoarchaeota archaeon]